MAFPFCWSGALVAGFFLLIVVSLFGLALRIVARATNEVKSSVLPGLVSGFRGWAAERGPAGAGSSSPPSLTSSPPFEEVSLHDGFPRARVRPHLR